MQTNQSVITQAIHYFCDIPFSLKNLGMVAYAPRVLSYAFIRTFTLSKSHHRSLLYLKKALSDISFQLKRSIGRFFVHR